MDQDWDACLAGFRRLYQLDLRTAFNDMPAVDFVALVDGLDDWGPHQENTALVLEHLAHAVTVEWQRLTTDPDDPEVQERRAEADAAGIKPPPVPLVTPMAHRPARWQRRRFEEFAERVSAYHLPEEPDELDPDAVLDSYMEQFSMT